MTEHDVIQIILSERRRVRLEDPGYGSQEWQAYQAAARRIVSECDSENRRAARTASFAGALITRGRTRL